MKIAVLSYGLPGPGERSGGIERVAHELADGWARRGHEVTVFSFSKPPKNSAYAVRSLPFGWWRRNPWGRRLLMGYLGNLLWLIPSYREFDVLVSHGDSLLLALKHRHIFRIFHGSALEEAKNSTNPLRVVAQLGVFFQEWLTSVLYEHTIAVSENTRHTLTGIKKVISNGVMLSRFRPGSEKEPRPTILCVGALGGRKRGGSLIKGFERRIKPNFPDARLWMVSEPGPEIDGVTYYSGVQEEKLLELYQRAWIFASPSAYEGFGLPYLEALACGTAVLAVQNPGSREVLSGCTFSAVVSSEDFVETLVRLLGEPEKLVDWGGRGPVYAKRFDLQKTIEGYLGYFEVVLGDAGKRQDKVGA